MRICVIDAETFDPLLKKYGSGSVFKYHYPEVEFKVLGFGIVDSKGYKDYITNLETINNNKLFNILIQYDAFIMHNAMYDLSCLKYLLRERYDELIENRIVIDTMLLAKLMDQHLAERARNKLIYGLDGLCSYFKLLDGKQSNILHDWAWNSGAYQKWYSESRPLLKSGKQSVCSKRPKDSVLESWCKTHMDLIPDNVTGDYCIKDCKATLSLYNTITSKENFTDDLIEQMSEIVKECVDMKFRGMRINLTACNKLSEKWKVLAEQTRREILNLIGKDNDFNINSSPQLGQTLADLGHKIPKTEAGNWSLEAKWLEKQAGEIFQKIILYRKAHKAEKDYIQKLMQYQEIIPDKYRKPGIGVLFPTIKPLGATATGRFSSGGGPGSLELNVLAISGRDENFGLPIREIFIPYEGETMVCADFSNQEPRLMVHYAHALGCDGIQTVVDDWNANPHMKYHQKMADMTQFEYGTAKMITLGLAYNMQAAGLSVRLNMSKEQALQLMQRYFEMVPFMQQLQTICENNLLRLGYIRTIDGRKLLIDPPYYYNGRERTQERLGMSKLIQGSAAGQTMKSMILARKAKLKTMVVVHDEMVISTSNPERDLPILRDCMENSYKLVVPVIAEAGIGSNWLQAKP